MGGLKDIFIGMSKIVGQAEQNLASKINGIASGEMASDGSKADSVDVAGGSDSNAAGTGSAEGNGASELSTEELLALQYDVQRFSIFNNMTTSTMQSVAGAYQSVTGNLNFR